VTDNLRHLRVFLSVADLGSVTKAAEACHVSQPAVTQAINKLEYQSGLALFGRTPQGMFLTEAGAVLESRVRRAFAILDPALEDLAPRLIRTVTTPQLLALIAVRDSENFTLAARQLGIAGPTVHRAVSQIEREAARPLFERGIHGMVATRAAQALAQAARLAFSELDQGAADLAEAVGREVGKIVIGAMPLSRAHILPAAIASFRKIRPTLPIKAVEGPYEELLGGLRRGEIDFLVGALRYPLPIKDIEQKPLFEDDLVLAVGLHHPLLNDPAITVETLARFPWIVAGAGTPTRTLFNQLFSSSHVGPPQSIVESGSMILMRELLRQSDHIGCISRLQIRTETEHGLLGILPFQMPGTDRQIGLTMRHGWKPTLAQKNFLDYLVTQAGS
jgi:LysR family transcriptional regulator, regulator for genes of the gallate degradation pathway